MNRIDPRRIVLVLSITASALAGGAIPSAGASAFHPLFRFDCGSAGTFYSEVNFVPSPLPAPFAPPPEAKVRLLTSTGAETDAVFVLLQVTSLGTGQVAFTNPGLEANQTNPNLATCVITRPDGQFEAVGLLTPVP